MTSAAANQYADQQRAATMAHHQNRIKWLASGSPVWACGTPVSRGEQSELRRLSENVLQGNDISSNHCNCKPRCA